MPTVLIATDADAVADEVAAAIEDERTTIVRLRAGAEVAAAVGAHDPDLVVRGSVDDFSKYITTDDPNELAVAQTLREEADMERLPDTAILMLLDRKADVFLAKRSQADGWLFKPLDSFRLRKAAKALLAGGDFHESTGIESVPVVAPTATS